jgi:hypothetical protein
MAEGQPEPTPSSGTDEHSEQAPVGGGQQDLEELKTVARADVYKNGELAATSHALAQAPSSSPTPTTG